MLSQKHVDDLCSSGLNERIINEMGFYTASSEEACELLDRKDITCECLVIPYPRIEGFFRLKPDGIIIGRDGKPAKYLQPLNQEPHIYTHPDIYVDINYSDLPILILEGEKKTLKAAQEFYFNEKLFLPICFGGVWNWRTKIPFYDKKGELKYKPGHIQDIENLPIDEKIVYICFDNDIANNPQVLEAEAALGNYLLGRGATRTYGIRIPYNGSKLGIDDYLVKYGNDAFKKLIDEASTSHLVQANIKIFRELPQKSQHEKLDLIVNAVVKDLRNGGKFFFDSAGAYYFNAKTKKILNLDTERFHIKLSSDYGFYRNTPEFKSVLTKLQEIAVETGQRTIIRNVSYIDKETRSSYIYDNNGGIIKVAKEELGSPVDIKRVNNGYDDVFFKHIDYEEFKYIPNSTGFFQKYLLDVCNFVKNENTILTHEQQILTFKVWFYSLFYPNLLPTKPILVMTGDYGSGKSTIQRLVGKLLFGSSFNVSTIQGERDFLASVINKYYLVYDNVDVNIEWIRNSIASLATGFKVEVRKLYSNMEMFQADPIAYLAMNSMTQSVYKRPDIASRLLIFRTKALGENKAPELFFENNISVYRNEILSEVMDNIAIINRYLYQEKDVKYRGGFRMADFADVGIRIAMAFGRELEFQNILNLLTEEQNLLPLEDNPLIDIIDRWLAVRLNPQWISTGELYAEFSKITAETKLPFPFKSVNTFGIALQSQMSNLKQIYYIGHRRGHGNRMMWDINHKERKRGE